jgi:hypothetical protein
MWSQFSLVYIPKSEPVKIIRDASTTKVPDETIESCSSNLNSAACGSVFGNWTTDNEGVESSIATAKCDPKRDPLTQYLEFHSCPKIACNRENNFQAFENEKRKTGTANIQQVHDGVVTCYQEHHSQRAHASGGIWSLKLLVLVP